MLKDPVEVFVFHLPKAFISLSFFGNR